MSQLDSMLKELKKSLSDDVSKKTAAIGSQMSEAEARELIKSQSGALKDFLKSNGAKVSGGVPQESEDPQVIVARRNALSAFVGMPLKNNGKAILSGTISVQAETHASNNGHKSPHEAQKPGGKPEVTEAPLPSMPPPPQVVLKYVEAPCKKCEESEKKEKEAAKSGGGSAGASTARGGSAAAASGGPGAGSHSAVGSSASSIPLGGTTAPSTATGSSAPGAAMDMPAASSDSTSAMGSMGFSKPVSPSPESEEKKPAENEERRGEERKAEKESAKDNKTEKKGFGLFNVFGKKDKSEERSKGDERKDESDNLAAASPAASPAAAPEKAKPNVFGSNANAAAQVAWFKHIQAIESALRIGDIHFAESLLSLLTEVSHSVAAGGNINARLDSMQARIYIDRKFFGEAEELLNKAIKNAEGTPLEQNIAIAYCWHALAQCYHAQKKLPETEKARKKAIEIATEALGENDPETVLLKAPL